MAEGLLSRARGTLAVVRELPGQRRVPYLPPERALERRDRRVREAVAFAAAHVPYYRELFEREGIDPRELRSADDLARLPLIEKRTVQHVRCGPGFIHSRSPTRSSSSGRR